MSDPIRPIDDEFRSRIDDVAAHASEIPASPLGPYGDVPVAYAVFQVTAAGGPEGTVRSHYVYANPEYCRIADCKPEAILGCSHLEVVKLESDSWQENCYRAAFLGETANGVDYSALTQGWVSFNIAPAAIEGCCVCAFVPIDEQERERRMSADARTSQIISEMLSALTGENGYEEAMNGMLEKAASIIRPDRLIVFECGGGETRNTFEWCAEGIAPMLGTMYNLPREVLRAWFKSVVKDPVSLVPDVSVLARFSPALHEWCTENDVTRFMAAPFYNEGDIVGFLGAYNYRIDEKVDINRVFGAISSFIGARIENRRLIDSLEWAGEHDALTGLLNRRGAEQAAARFVESHPGEPYALVLIDLDDFKRENDVYGHAAGDEALKAVAQVVVESFPEGVILSRNGGDEFLAMLTGEDAGRVDELVEGFARIEVEYEFDGNRHRVTTSTGYARHPEQGASLAEIYKNADDAMYSVKLSGRSGFKKYSKEERMQNRAYLGFTPRDIASNIPCALAVHKADASGEILFVNEELVELVECDSMQDVISHYKGSFWEMLHPIDLELSMSKLAEQVGSVEASQKTLARFRIITKQDKEKEVLVNGRIMDIDEVGTVVYTLLIDHI